MRNPRLDSLLDILERVAAAKAVMREGRVFRTDSENRRIHWLSDSERVERALADAAEECRLQIARVVGRRNREG